MSGKNRKPYVKKPKNKKICQKDTIMPKNIQLDSTSRYTFKILVLETNGTVLP
jgi:hypothetical protein